jgi:DNA-binding transcriptional LysR family regulator
MELRQLRYAVTLADELHFGRAAAREHVAQSAFSQQIQRLERDLRVRLFDRSTHHVRLTDAGRVFVEEAARILAALDGAVETTRRRASTGKPPRLRFGCAGYMQWWPQIRALHVAFATDRPDVEVQTSFATVPDLLDALVEDRLDAVVVNGQVVQESLVGAAVVDMPVEVMLPAGHPLASHREIDVQQLAGERLILWPREVNPVVYDDMLRFFDRHEVTVEVVEVTQMHQAWLGAVAAGEGFSLIAAANRLGHDGVVRRPFRGEEGPALDIRLVWRRDDPSPEVVDLVEALRRVRGTRLRAVPGG